MSPQDFQSFRTVSYTENYEIMNLLITKAKASLMSRDNGRMVEAVNWINNCLNILDKNERKIFIENLIAVDLATILCKALCCTTDKLLISMLNVVRELRFNETFYVKKLAASAISSICKSVYFMRKNPQNYEDSLKWMAFTLYVIINQAFWTNFSLEEIYDSDDIIRFLKIMQSLNSSESFCQQTTAKLLHIIMINMTLGQNENTQSSLFMIFEHSLMSMSAIILKEANDNNNNSDLEVNMGIICNLCAAGARFCNDDDEESSNSNFQFRIRERNFRDTILKILIELVLPLFKDITFGVDHYTYAIQALFDCLKVMFSLETCDSVVLAKCLANHGYLKYLLQFLPSKSHRRSISSLISWIVSNLWTESLSSDQFRTYIHNGFLELPYRCNQFHAELSTSGIGSDALIILLYYHFRATAERNLFRLDSVINKIMSLTAENSSIPVVRATWLLFSVSSLKHCIPTSVTGYHTAIVHLEYLVSNFDFGKCYTHHAELITHVLSCKDFSGEFRNKVVELWLHFGGDDKTISQLGKLSKPIRKKRVHRAINVCDWLRSNESMAKKKRWTRLEKVLVFDYTCHIDNTDDDANNNNNKHDYKTALKMMVREIN